MMTLVPYSSSETSSDEEMLPFPDSLNTFRPDERLFHPHIDDPKLHSDRKRTFAHEVGNWATSVFVKVEIPWFLDLVQSLYSNFGADLQDWSSYDSTELHVSLSKTWPVRYHWIDSLVSLLRRQLVSEKAFCINLQGAHCFTNEDESRSFISLGFEDTTSFIELEKHVSHIMKEFGCPEFYQDPIFHVSFLWSLGDHKHAAQMPKVIRFITQAVETYNRSLIVRDLTVKCGNKIFHIPLG